MKKNYLDEFIDRALESNMTVTHTEDVGELNKLVEGIGELAKDQHILCIRNDAGNITLSYPARNAIIIVSINERGDITKISIC